MDDTVASYWAHRTLKKGCAFAGKIASKAQNKVSFVKGKQNSLHMTDYGHGCDSETVGVDAIRPCSPCMADLSTLYCSQTEEYSAPL